MKKRIVILGSTGSIGSNLIELIINNKSKFKVELLSTNKNITKVVNQAKILNVKNIIINDKKKFLDAQIKYKSLRIKFYNNSDLLNEIIKKKIDYSMCSIMGINGLKSTLEIIKYSKNIAVANKESIICGWSLIKKELIKYKTNILPIDSEHYSIWTLLNKPNLLKNIDFNLDKLIITASGGPFWDTSFSKFKKISPNSAKKHPIWKMGSKISIDSATLMNKVFETIEAQRLFNVDFKNIEIRVHKSSYVHAILRFNDGIIKLCAHEPTMKIPIFGSLENGNSKFSKSIINFDKFNTLDFKKIDKKKFKTLKILDNYPKSNSLYDTALVSANDTLVELFLNKKITFDKIFIYLLKILQLKYIKSLKKIKPNSYLDIERVNKIVRVVTYNLV